MVIIKSENKNEFKLIIEQLDASNITVSKTDTPGYFAISKADSTPGFLLFIVVVIGIILGFLFVGFINSAWLHQVGNKPHSFSRVVGWLPVIFEITIFFTAFIYFMRFILAISKKEKEKSVLLHPMYYYCFLNPKNESELQYILKNFETHQIIEC